MPFGRWKINECDEKAVQTISKELSVCEITAKILINRGYATPELAREFLENDSPVGGPMKLKDIDIAAARIHEAIENGERIAVFGDYDVDGVTSTALMYQYLQSCGADVVCSLPTRESSGYGISNEAIDNLKKYDVGLIVTVDNGISSYNEVNYAKILGIDVIICDHHLPPELLPQAEAVVNPLRKDDTSFFKELAGVGVALKLAAAVEGCAEDELLDTYGYLVAIGTISDIMPLVGENRTIVKTGVAQLRECENPGLAALCEVAEIDISAIEVGNIAFGIAPRLNAAGRMDSADIALRLMITEDYDEARELAERLAELNDLRRQTETEITKRVNEEIEKDSSILKKPIIIVAAENLHSGVTGIVSSRLVDRYGKPAVIISIDGDDAKGSGRSVAGFSLHEAIASCSELLLKFGGHDMAAGFTLKTKDIKLLKDGIYDYCRKLDGDLPYPDFELDAIVGFSDINENIVSEIGRLAPFGHSNEEPVFGVRDAEVVSVAPLSERHSKITLKQGSETFAGALFGKTPDTAGIKPGDKVDAAFILSMYRARHKDIVSARFRDIRASGIDDAYYDSIKAYRSFCTGRGVSKNERELLSPTREDVAYVYREIKGGLLLDETDYAVLSMRFGKLPLGKVSAVLDILSELELTEMINDVSGRRLTRAVSNPKKNDLNSSKLYIQLHEGTDELQRA